MRREHNNVRRYRQGRGHRRGVYRNAVFPGRRAPTDEPQFSVITQYDVESDLRGFFRNDLQDLRAGNVFMIRQFITSRLGPITPHHCLVFLFVQTRVIFTRITHGSLLDFIHRIHLQASLYFGDSIMPRNNSYRIRAYNPDTRRTNHNFPEYDRLVETNYFRNNFVMQQVNVLVAEFSVMSRHERFLSLQNVEEMSTAHIRSLLNGPEDNATNNNVEAAHLSEGEVEMELDPEVINEDDHGE